MEGIVLNFRFKIDPSKPKVLNTLSTDENFQILRSLFYETLAQEKEESNISDFS